MSETITIGVDHGYAAMKTTHCAFPTGLVEYDHEPYTQQDVLEYGGKFYVVGSGRQPLQKDKTATEDYYLLTLAAIAKELAHRGAEPTAAVHLAAGLPLTSSAQASYPSPRRRRQGLLISLCLLSPCDPFRWARMGPPPQPSEAVAVGRGGRNGAGGVLAVRRGRNRAEFLPMRGCCAPMRCPPNSCRLFPKRLIKREKCRSDRRGKRYSTAEPDISFSRSPFVYWTSYVPWAKSKHASFPLASM